MLLRDMQESILDVGRVARHVEKRLGPTVHRASRPDSGKFFRVSRQTHSARFVVGAIAGYQFGQADGV